MASPREPALGASMLGVGGGMGPGALEASSVADDRVVQLVLQLSQPDEREGALLELSKKREAFTDLAPLIWKSYGTIAALLQEIVAIYPLLSPPALTAHASNRVCNALALMQCVASHNDTRAHFLQAHIPLFLYPFLNTTAKTRPFEYLRLTSLGVVVSWNIAAFKVWKHHAKVFSVLTNRFFFFFFFFPVFCYSSLSNCSG